MKLGVLNEDEQLDYKSRFLSLLKTYDFKAIPTRGINIVYGRDDLDDWVVLYDTYFELCPKGSYKTIKKQNYSDIKSIDNVFE